MNKEPNAAEAQRLADLAGNMTTAGEGGVAGHARRAFELAHRARRLCEQAAEHASRNRWTVLQVPAAVPIDPIQRFAQECAAVVIQYPKHGEAAVYAALLSAADCAREVSDKLYEVWLGTQPKQPPSTTPGPVTKLGGAMAPGCRWNRPPEEDEG